MSATSLSENANAAVPSDYSRARWVMAQGGSNGAAAAVMLTSLAGMLISGPQALISAAGVGLLVFGFFASGQWIESLTMLWGNTSGLVVNEASYGVRIAIFGGIMWWAAHNPALEPYTLPAWIAIGAVSTIVGWVAGLMVGHSRARIPTYDVAYVPRNTDDEALQTQRKGSHE